MHNSVCPGGWGGGGGGGGGVGGGGPMPIFGNLLGEFKSLKFQWVGVGGGSVNPDPLQIFV